MGTDRRPPRWRYFVVLGMVGVVSCVGGIGAETTIPTPVDLSRAVEAGDRDTVRSLLAEGADPDQPLVFGLTPLMRAVNRDAADIVELLVDAGAEIEAPGLVDQTATHLAARANAVDSLQVLLAAGADPENRTREGMNALDVAADAGAVEAIDYLVTDVGLDIDRPSRVVTQGHGYPRDTGPTPLALAVRADRLQAAEKLLALGADVDAESGAGHTPLLTAVFFDRSSDIVQTLLDAGADLEARARCEAGCSHGSGRMLTVTEWAIELEREQLLEVLSAP